MEISLQNAGKKFGTEWIFRGLNLRLYSGIGYAFTGANGSGKSTLIRLIMGQIPLNEGEVSYSAGGRLVHIDEWYRYIVLAAPYLELVEEFTLTEFTAFHQRFKPFKRGMPTDDFIEFSKLSRSRNKLIRHFSSGMKQRLRLALAFQTDVPVVFLDEPTSNLDQSGIEWYHANVTQLLGSGQIVVVGSNQPSEYSFCSNQTRIEDFKTNRDL